MTQSTQQDSKQDNKPLWKVLNEQTPELKFDVKAGDKNFMRLVGYMVDAPTPANFKEQTEQEEQLYIASKYTALAVNNLHIIAEALECMKSNIETIGKNARTEIDTLNLQIISETMKKIS